MKTILAIGLFAAGLTAIAGGIDDNTQSWKHFPFQTPGSEIVFPQDEGSHPGIPNLEWWYAVLHLKGKTTGDQYSVLVSHFNNQIRFFTMTNLTRQKHASGSTMGLLHSPTGRLDLTHRTKYGIDHFKSVGAFDYQVETFGPDMHLDVALSGTKKPMMVGGDGYIPVGNSGNTFYYSITRLQATGSLTFLGLTESVEGEAWMDHQWGPFLVSPFPIGNLMETYEWFCVQLDNGEELMVSNIFDRHNNLPLTEAYGGVQISLQNGEMIHTQNKTFNRTRFWQDPVSKEYMSMGWTLDVPEQDIHLEFAPDFLDQMVPLPLKGSFWEGSIPVTGTVAGKVVTGKAFGELIHRYELPELQIDSLKSLWAADETLNMKWKVLNPDAGNPLNYQVYLKVNGGEVLLRSYLVNPETQIPMAEVKALLMKDGLPLRAEFIVKAQSVDGVISSRTSSTQLLIQ